MGINLNSQRLRLRRSAGRPRLLSCVLFVVLMGPFSYLTWAQITSGSLTGVVTDPSNAVVPGAQITLTDVTKGFEYKGTTDAAGRYVITDLPPSTYKISVQAEGFKTYIQEGITLDVGTRSSLDVSLQLGAAIQFVQVVGAAHLLATQDAVTGQNVDRRYVNDLPLIGRAVYDLAFLAPGVIQAPGGPFGPNYVAPNNFVSNGGRNSTAEVLIDGVSATSYEPNGAITQVLYTPSVDAVQEFKVMQNNYTAEEGFTGGTYVNTVLRSGTNQFHGSLWEFLRNDKLDANNFFTNERGGKIPPLRRNQFGGTAGGPIKKNKTFFFADYEGTREHALGAHNAGVPDAAERSGDFGALCGGLGPNGPAPTGQFNAQGLCSDPNGQLWDPYSGVYDPANSGRDLQTFIPFNNLATYVSPGNPALNSTGYQLPATRGNLIDPVAQKMMSYFPLPNLNVGTPSYNPYLNWSGEGIQASRRDQFDIKVDHQFTQRTSFTGRFSFERDFTDPLNCFGNVLDPCSWGPTTGNSRGLSLSLTHSFSPSTLINLTYGFSRNFVNDQGIGANYPSFDPVKDLGLPAYIKRSGLKEAPAIYLYGGYQQVYSQALGGQGWAVYRDATEVHHLMATMTRMQGRHEIKFGGEMRVNRMNWFQAGVPEGAFVYDQYSTSEFPYWGGGDTMASFLTGVGGSDSWGEYDINTHMSTQNFRYGGFVQDNLRANDKLTVNIGVRYDLEIPRTERYNRGNYLDPNIAMPIHPAAVDPKTWPSILPVPDLSNPRGGYVFLSPTQRHPFATHWNNFGPRVGLSYRVLPKTVLRTGYGLFYNPTDAGVIGGASASDGIEGFQALTPWLTTYQGDGVTPWGRLSDPYPITGPPYPTGNSLGVLTQLGQGVTAPFYYQNAVPYVQTWSFGLERELRGNVLIDANYIGTKGTHLYFNGAGNLDYLGKWVENPSTALVNALATRVPNPYYGVITNPFSSLSGPTVPASQLLLPYPQFTGFTSSPPPWSNSIYHAFQLRVEKRMSQGLQFLVTYTNSKSIDDSSVSSETYLGGFTQNSDPNNRKLMRSLSEWDIPQVLQVAYVYQLPFGRGKRWGSGWNPIVNGLLGGWQTNGVWRFDNGQPIHLSLNGGAAPATYGSQEPNLLGTLKVNPKSLWFTKGYFANPEVAAVPPLYTVGTAPRMLPSTRLPGTNNASLSVFKEISLAKMREGSRLEFRAEAFNALNHPQLGCLNSTVNTGSFGTITCQANLPREVQMALKLYF